MTTTTIALRRVENSRESITEGLAQVLDTIKARDMIQGKQHILIKPNLLGDQPPERAVTTDNRLIGAIIDWLLANGVQKDQIFVGESSGGMGREHTKKAFEASLLAKECDERGIRWEPFENTELQRVELPDGKVLNHVHLSTEVLGADLIINVPKIKTHGQMVMTLSIKNMFGTMVKAVKPKMHARFPGSEDFANALVDIYSASANIPQLIIMDGVLAMEGNGPGRAGTPVELGLLLAGTDPLAMDLSCSVIAGVEPDLVFTNVAARKRHRWIGDFDHIIIDGPTLAEVVRPFAIPSFHKIERWFLNHFTRATKFFMGKFSAPKISIDPELCDRDAICVRSCPTKALSMPKGKGAPIWDKEKCIGCTCCMELCPEGAITAEMAGIKGILPYALPLLLGILFVIILIIWGLIQLF